MTMSAGVAAMGREQRMNREQAFEVVGDPAGGEGLPRRGDDDGHRDAVSAQSSPTYSSMGRCLVPGVPRVCGRAEVVAASP